MTPFWVDILMITVLIGCIFIGRRSGFIDGLFKLLGIFFSTIIGLHYYVRLGKFLGQRLSLSGGVEEILAFLLLIFCVYFIFYLMAEGWQMILKLEIPFVLNAWGGMILAGMRSLLLCGLIYLGLVISPFHSVSLSAKDCGSGFFWRGISIGIYHRIYVEGISRFFTAEPVNEKVLKLFDKKEIEPSLPNSSVEKN